jgi:hypothetical protein
MSRHIAVLLALALGAPALVACSGATPPVTPPVASDAVLGPNDVSVLLPLPADGNYSAYPSVSTAGNGGALIPRSVFDAIPPVNPRVETSSDPYAMFRMLAVRFDPCFTATTTGSSCEPQIRIIFQPVDATDGPLDGAMHAFYRLTGAQFAELVEELRRLHDVAPENETGVMSPSPAITAQGIGGPYATGLFALVSRYAGAATLRRVTFMERTEARQTQWRFGFFEVAASVATRTTIAEIDAETQTVNNMIGTGPEFLISPLATTDEDLTALLTSGARMLADEGTRDVTYRAVLALENPLLNQPDEAQCAACHVASSVGRQVEGDFGLDAMPFAERYATDRAITAPGDTATDPEVMRIFGWFARRPAIAPRAVHETAHVLDVIDADYPITAD